MGCAQWYNMNSGTITSLNLQNGQYLNNLRYLNKLMYLNNLRYLKY